MIQSADKDIMCPLSLTTNCSPLFEYDREALISRYKTQLSIDVSSYLPADLYPTKYRCEDCGFIFFHPDSLAGNDGFYQELQRFAWYYLAGKWEHEKAQRFIRPSDRILEVGFGAAHFLKDVHQQGKDITGLEMNSDAIEKAQIEGLQVFSTSIEEFAKSRSQDFDVVCSFQVLEHIPQVHSFLSGMVQAAKTGGSIMIGVPNNDSFIKLDDELPLNMPPHHMGRWTPDTLAKLQDFFPLKLEEIFLEPLPLRHVHWYLKLNLTKRFGKLLGRALSIIFFPILYLAIWVGHSKIPGDTMLARFVKIEGD